MKGNSHLLALSLVALTFLVPLSAGALTGKELGRMDIAAISKEQILAHFSNLTYAPNHDELTRTTRSTSLTGITQNDLDALEERLKRSISRSVGGSFDTVEVAYKEPITSLDGITLTNPTITGATLTDTTADFSALSVDSGTLYVDTVNDRVGIGTTNPISARLVIQGSTSDSTAVALNATNSGGTSLLYVRNDGSVGIGTTDPGNPSYPFPLHVDGGIGRGIRVSQNNGNALDFAASADSPRIHYRSSAGGNRFTTCLDITNDKFYLTTGACSPGSAKFTMDTNGNVGIGTTSPWAKLSVTNTGSGPSFLVEDSASPDSTPFVVNASGNVGIGTAGPTNLLTLNAIAGYDVSTVGTESLDITTAATTGGGIGLGPRNTTRLFINTSGNVGISTTSPWRKLSVSGTVGFDGLTAAGVSGSALCLSANKEVVVNTGTQTCTVSSKRFKHDIESLGGKEALETALSLRPVSFSFNETDEPRLGLIAEEVDDIEPRLVAREPDGRPRSVRYEDLTAILLAAIKEQERKITALASGTLKSIDDTLSATFGNLFARTIVVEQSVKAKSVEAQEELRTNKRLCVGETCITEEEFRAVFIAQPDAKVDNPASDGSVTDPAANGTDETQNSADNGGEQETNDDAPASVSDPAIAGGQTGQTTMNGGEVETTHEHGSVEQGENVAE